MGKSGRGLSLAFFFIFTFFPPLFFPLVADDGGGLVAGGFPVITRLDSRDTGFAQFIADVEHNRMRLFGREREIPFAFGEFLTVYQYTPVNGENIFTLAARCNIPYAAIASLNRLDNPVMLDAGMPLLLPSCPGIFLPALPRSDFENLLAAARISSRDNEAAQINVNRRGGEPETFYFFPGADFNSTERIFFLNTGFRFPLRNFRLTSVYGIRRNPVTGNVRLHQGLDLAAPEGTEVFAAGDGIVTETGEDAVYGKYIVIKHGEKWASLYGHLQKIEITLRSFVESGTLIGRVGSTGQSTGPHLHFELRENGRALDPGKYLFQGG